MEGVKKTEWSGEGKYDPVMVTLLLISLYQLIMKF